MRTRKKVGCRVDGRVTFQRRSVLMLVKPLPLLNGNVQDRRANTRNVSFPFLYDGQFTLTSMLVRCYWCISILIIIPTIRCCSLTGPRSINLTSFQIGRCPKCITKDALSVSESLRRCLQQQGVRTVFKSDTTLRSHLVRPKDALEPTKQDGVVYKIPCM